MAKTYYTLFTREDDNKWYPQFGDYAKKTVADEMREYRGEYKAKDICIIQHLDTATIDQLIALANSKATQ